MFGYRYHVELASYSCIDYESGSTTAESLVFSQVMFPIDRRHC